MALYTIGDLARRTGLTVKTIRFYADRGIVPPTDRTPAGHRLYGVAAAARLDLVRTLRDLGLDLPTIQKVLDQEVSLSQVAAAHAEALDAQMRTLRLRRAVLSAVARRGSTPEEMEFMHKLARLSETERQALIDDFLDTVLGGLDFPGVRRTMTPALPDDPSTEQVEAWVELADLSRDPDFRAGFRRMADEHAAASTGLRRDLGALVREHANQAVENADALTAAYAALTGSPDDAELRQAMLTRLEHMNDPRRDRYFELLAVINGWPPPEPLTPAITWAIDVLTADRPGS